MKTYGRCEVTDAEILRAQTSLTKYNPLFALLEKKGVPVNDTMTPGLHEDYEYTQDRDKGRGVTTWTWTMKAAPAESSRKDAIVAQFIAGAGRDEIKGDIDQAIREYIQELTRQISRYRSGSASGGHR